MKINKKKILLCAIHDLSNKYNSPPAGAAYISAALKRDSFNITYFVWDLSRSDNENVTGLSEAVLQNSRDMVMCGGMAHDYKVLHTLFKTAKSISSTIITVQGGAFVTNSPMEAMELLPDCDIGVIGEGEITICELMQNIEKDEDISSVKGIIYRDNSGHSVITDERAELPDLETLPIPDYDELFGDLLNNTGAFSIASGRGCNFACTFCTQRKKYRERPLEKVFEELDYYASRYKFHTVGFANDYFNTDKEYLSNFCEKLKKYDVRVVLQTRIASNLTLDVFRQMRESGVCEIFFGLESADNTVLKSMRKGITAELMLKVLTDVKKARIHANGFFIFGDTVETYETVMRTLAFVKEHRDLFFNADFLMIRLFPGSSVYKKAVAEGKIDPINHIKNLCPAVNFSKLSDEEYRYLNDFYFNYFFITEFLADLNIKDVSFERIDGKHKYIFNFDCISCGKRHTFDVDLKSTTYHQSNFFCDCGERLVLDFFYYLINTEKIDKMLKEYKTAFYGIGGVFYKHYYKCALAKSQREFFLLNGSVMMSWLPDGTSNEIHSPENIEKYNIEKVIVTLSGYYDIDSIISDLRMKHPKTEFMLWYDV